MRMLWSHIHGYCRALLTAPYLEASEAASLWPSAPLRQLLRRDIALSQSAGINFNDAAVLGGVTVRS